MHTSLRRLMWDMQTNQQHLSPSQYATITVPEGDPGMPRACAHLSTVPMTKRRLSGSHAPEETMLGSWLYVCAQCPVSTFHSRTYAQAVCSQI